MTATLIPPCRYLISFPPPNEENVDELAPWEIVEFQGNLITSEETFQIVSDHWGADFEIGESEAAYERDLVQHHVRSFGGHRQNDL